MVSTYCFFGSSLIIFQVYSNHSIFIYNLLLDPDISSFGLPTDSISSNPPITVSSLYHCIFYIPLTDVLVGWNLFVAAMTPYDNLRSNLIERIYNRSQLFAAASGGPGVFPLNYYSANGSDIPRVFPPSYNGSQYPTVQGVFR